MRFDSEGNLLTAFNGTIVSTATVTGTLKPTFEATTENTITLASLGSSATFVAGQEGTEIQMSGGFFISGKITVGTTPTINTEIRVYIVAKLNDSNWPDVFDGTNSAETVTSVGILDSIGRLAASIKVDSTTSDRSYPFGPVWVPALFGAPYQPQFVVPFVTHNTGVALNSGAGNHYISIGKMNETLV